MWKGTLNQGMATVQYCTVRNISGNRPLCFILQKRRYPGCGTEQRFRLDSWRAQIGQPIFYFGESSGTFRKRVNSRSNLRVVSAVCSALLIAAAARITSSSAFFLASEHASILGESRLENRGFVAGFLTTS